MSPSFNAQPLPPERWRVFLSHTSELRQFPANGESYVDHVERAVIAAGHCPVDMADFMAQDQPPADVCVERVRGCDVYVGLYGLRYGSPVRERPSKSYTELEFETATDAQIPRLVFIVDQTSTQLGLPPQALVDRRHGQRQDAFLRRVREEAGLTVQTFRNPDDLRAKVAQALTALAGPMRSGPISALAGPRPVPELLPYLPDRHQQEELMVASLQRLLATDPATPTVVILHGEEDQRLERFRARFLSDSTLFRHQLAPRFLDVPWPRELNPGERFREDFLQWICHHLLMDSRATDQLETLLGDASRPVVLWSSFNSDDWDRQGRQRLEAVCRFWRESPVTADKPLLYWITINYLKPAPFAREERQVPRWPCTYLRHVLRKIQRRRLNQAIRSTLQAIDTAMAKDRAITVFPEIRSVSRSDAEGWVQSPPVREFLQDQHLLLALEDEVREFYRRWEAKHGMTVIPLDDLGRFLRERLLVAGQA
ncbi:MAG: DUF4062 domain-containing protein [Cyanobacteriota bacterium]